MAQDTLEIPFEEAESARRGRLLRLKIKRSHAARQDALASIRDVPGGKVQARIGGRLRGRTETFASRSQAENAVNEHYNEQMQAFVERRSVR